MSLQEQLRAMKATSREQMPEETLAIMARALQQLEATGQLQKSLGAGACMPAFSLQDFSGKTFSSQELLQQGPLVINFYRGSW